MFASIRNWFRRLLEVTEEMPSDPTAAPLYAEPLVHHVIASSFADPGDVARFHRCKRAGGTDQQCFKVGDNGIGCWGDDTTGPVPGCALPREDWKPLGTRAHGAKVIVTANGKTITCRLMDTMPSRANIKNGCGIDLNPAAVKALGLIPPIKIRATWSWS